MRSPRLTPATRLGPYEIVRAIGAGGMGEVYRARDTRLGRDVAIKVLPADLGGNAQLQARFEREAKSVSSLNHPHICTLYDVGRESVDGSDVQYLVLELIEGETLAARLVRGPLPVAEVIALGIQIASALGAAHRRGIVHRDLKPGNVMLAKAGAKLLDFGLATSRETLPPDALSALPTREKSLTGQGAILGTFQYMAPEQHEAQAADARTDIFALGAVLHEMATGRKAFEGKTRTSLIAAIVSSQPPPISSVQPMSPPALDHVVRKCLEKDPEDRWQSARDVVSELQWIAEGGSPVGLPTAAASRRRNRERLAWSAFALASLVALAILIGYVRREPPPAQVVRFEIPTPAILTSVGPPQLSPDGRMVAFNATDATGNRLVWVRSLDAVEPRPLPGTESARRPFWSPDSRNLAFMSQGKLKRVPIAGGPPQTICDLPNGADGAWSRQGVILIDGRGNDPLWSVPATGGTPKIEVQPDPGRGTVGASWPDFLPDGRHFLYVANGPNPGENQLVVAQLDSKDSRTLMKTPSRVLYAPPGYLLYVREQTIVAQPFDANALAFTGEPIPLAEGIGVTPGGLARFSVSETGALAFRAANPLRALVWVDRSGKEGDHVGEVAEYGDFWPSPDGQRLAFDAVAGRPRTNDLWIRDLARGATSRFTFDPASDTGPVWSPDGRRIAFTSSRKGPGDLYVKDASGTGEESVLLESPEEKHASDWSRDGRNLLFISRGAETGWDLWALPLEGERKAFPVRTTRFSEIDGRLSPDGRLVACSSNESGRFEVYVQEFPQAKSKWQISTGGGQEPAWRGDGRELFYVAGDSKVMAVSIQTTPSFSAGTPQPLFQARLAPTIQLAHYRVTGDGQRFLILAPFGRDATVPTTIILNWPAALKQ